MSRLLAEGGHVLQCLCYDYTSDTKIWQEKQSVGTNLIHDFTAVTFSVKLTFFREKR